MRDMYLRSCGDESTEGSKLVACAGVGGGQPGGSAMAWPLLAADQPSETLLSQGGKSISYACRWRVATGGATRSSGGGPRDRPPPKKIGTKGFRVNISVPNIFCGATTRFAFSINPSPSRYPTIDRLPLAACLGLLQRDNARIGGPLTA
jgi:hypothetical protein